MNTKELELLAQQFLRALRGHRSQVAWSRRLGYRSNVAAGWESGRRAPTALEAFRAAERSGVDVAACVHRFRPRCPVSVDITDPPSIGAWLSALRGGEPLRELAERSGVSRHRLSRWLAGRSQPRLPDFLRVVHSLTGRADELVAGLVGAGALPSMEHAQNRRDAIRGLAYRQPWSAAVLTFLESKSYQESSSTGIPWIAEQLGAPVGDVSEALTALRRANLATPSGGRWMVTGSLTVDVRRDADMRSFKGHWAQVAAERVQDPREGDQTSINLFVASTGDIKRIGELQRRFYREVRAIVAASEDNDQMGLLVLQLRHF